MTIFFGRIPIIFIFMVCTSDTLLSRAINLFYNCSLRKLKLNFVRLSVHNSLRETFVDLDLYLLLGQSLKVFSKLKVALLFFQRYIKQLPRLSNGGDEFLKNSYLGRMTIFTLRKEESYTLGQTFAERTNDFSSTFLFLLLWFCSLLLRSTNS